MQLMSHDDAYRREMAPQEWAEPDVYEEQDDQWAVLRHEVEVEDMKRQDERVRSSWEQRDTEEDSIASQSSLDELQQAQHHVDIVVAGIGGGGMNAVNRMISTRVRGVRFIAMNTDVQVLGLSEAPDRICLGQHYTKGLGAGGSASVGTRAATESTAEIRAALGEAALVFIAAGMGGGTGTGAAPIVASIAKKLGALTIGIVTLPFTFEGTQRRRIAMQGIAELITVPGLVNVDFADVRSVLRQAGSALMSIGQGQGRNRAQQAAEEAVAGGFLNVTIRGATRVLFNISGGEDMTLFEVNEVAERIGQAVDNAADITFGAVVDPSLNDTIRVTLIAAGMEELHTARLPAIRLDQARPMPINPASSMHPQGAAVPQ